MKMLRFIAAALFLAVFNPAAAQWQTPDHSVPIGRGAGKQGFSSAAPGATGLPVVSNGATADPSFQALPNAGLAFVPANSVKGAIAGGSPVDLPLPATTCSGLGWLPGTGFSCGGAASAMYTQITGFGAACNAVLVSSGTVSIASGSTSLVVTAATFTSADATAHKSIWVPGAGPSGAGLSTTIATFVNPTTVTLTAAASTTVTAAALTQAKVIAYGTDDTAAIQSAIVATPAFGTLFINPISLNFPVVGCLIKQTGSSGASLTVDHPINILGGGNGSALITDPSMGTTVTAIHAPISGVTWNGVVWTGWSLGTNINFVPFSRYGSLGIWFDATTGGAGGFQGVTVTNLRLGESAGGFSLLMDGVGSQGNRFINSTIWGGLELNNVIDSNVIRENRFQGASIFGVVVTMSGGNFQYIGNSMTAAGGFCLAGSTGSSVLMPVIHDNYFEENALTPPQFQHGAFVDIGCSAGVSITSAQIHDNIIANIVSSSTLAVKIDPATVSTALLNNFIANNTARTAVLNNGTSTNCGPNHFQTSTTLTSGSGTFANACTNY